MTHKLIIAFLLVPVISFSQSKRTDSLYKQLGVLKDSARVDCLNALSALYTENLRRDSAQYFAALSLDEAKKIDYVHGIAVSLSNKARIIQHFDNDFANSEKLAKEAIALFDKTNDKRGLDDAYEIRQFSVFSESKFDEAYEEVRRNYLISL